VRWRWRHEGRMGRRVEDQEVREGWRGGVRE